jgi:serine/threonine protein kinase
MTMDNSIKIIKPTSSSDEPNLERPTSQPKLPQAPDPNLVKLLENKYQIEKCIGMGAQSYVYKAKRISDNSSVAIK